MTNTSKFEGKTDAQLKELKASLDEACGYCTTQQGQFWGRGQQDGADLFQKNAEEFAKASQAIQDELDSRKESSMTPEEKKASAANKKEQEEQNVSSFPPNIKPADQPTPATQPYEPSTEAQGTANKKQ